jgi:hypothetical protein
MPIERHLRQLPSRPPRNPLTHYLEIMALTASTARDAKLAEHMLEHLVGVRLGLRGEVLVSAAVELALVVGHLEIFLEYLEETTHLLHGDAVGGAMDGLLADEDLAEAGVWGCGDTLAEGRGHGEAEGRGKLRAGLAGERVEPLDQAGRHERPVVTLERLGDVVRAVCVCQRDPGGGSLRRASDLPTNCVMSTMMVRWMPSVWKRLWLNMSRTTRSNTSTLVRPYMAVSLFVYWCETSAACSSWVSIEAEIDLAAQSIKSWVSAGRPFSEAVSADPDLVLLLREGLVQGLSVRILELLGIRQELRVGAEGHCVWFGCCGSGLLDDGKSKQHKFNSKVEVAR